MSFRVSKDSSSVEKLPTFSMGQEYTRIHTFSVGNWPKGVNPCIFPLIYPYQWKCTRIHTFWPKGVNPCTFLTHTLWTRNVQGFTYFQIKCQKPSKMKRCESLYIPGPYLMGRKHTRIHTFSNGSKFEKVWIHVCFLNLKHLDGIYKDSHLFKFGLKKNHLEKCKSL